MPRIAKDPEREHRIAMEAIVDANGPEEQAVGWYYYLEDKIHFPFRAKCIIERATSPLRTGGEVEVTGIASEADCEREMFVEVQWDNRKLVIPLVQVQPLADSEVNTNEAIADWHYWVIRGYEF